MQYQVPGSIDTPAELVGRTVADVMLRQPKTLPVTASVAEARAALYDDHVHVVLLVDDGILAGAVDRTDLTGAPDSAPALEHAVLDGRTVVPTAAAEEARQLLLATGRRRLAVMDEDGTLLGLLCLKRRRTGFCSDADVAARAGAGGR
ncbi:CBS domain-containing protein [Nocardioides sp.]|uniref:CBS domain-containing protein n=1 Tax=Nocardioides sp. TaxID=35761 RepID=UPI002ED8DDBF